MHHRLSAVLILAAAAFAQEPAKPAPAATAPAAAQAPAENAAVLDKALAKMLAVSRGSFTYSEEQDPAMLRGRGMPGNEGTEITGGWSSDLVWGTAGEDEFALRNGRLVAKTAHGWKLRGKTLPSGAPTPFTLQPVLLFALLAQLPADARKITHSEPGELGGKPVSILTLEFEGDVADDLAESGVLPAVGGGPMLRIGGMMGGAAPAKAHRIDLALFVDPSNGDVLRLRAKVFEDDPMLANVQINFQGPGGAVGNDDTDEKEEAKADVGKGALKYKKGLPDRKPGKTESTCYAKIEFQNLGRAEAPALDDGAKSWLGIK